jgi:hypothetical protein
MSKAIREFGRRVLTGLLVHEVEIENYYKNCKKIRPLIQQREIPTPEVENMDFWQDARYLQQAIYTLPDIYSTTINNVLYCTRNHLLMTDFPRRIIANSVPTDVPHNYTVLEDMYLRKTDKISGVCTIFQAFPNDFYHQLIDNLPRLYHLHQPEYKNIEEIKVICSDLSEVEKVILPQLLPENAKIFLVDCQKNYLIENLIYPSFLTKINAAYLPSEYLSFVTKRVCSQAPRKKNQRIYISRKYARMRRLLNEEQLLEALKKYNFQQYFLEKMTIEEQIELFYDAEIILGSHGAGFANIIFSEKVHVIELFPSKFIWMPVYYFLAKSMQHHYHYLCSGRELNYENYQPILSEKKLSPHSYFKDRDFTVNVSEVTSLLDKIL